MADYLAAYEDEMEGLRAYDRALFGGSPEEVHDVYVRSSPITYVDAVAAPVLVVAGANDPRCPIRQIDNYLGELEKLGKEHEVYRFDAGHGSLVIEETIRQVEVALAFALRHVAAVQRSSRYRASPASVSGSASDQLRDLDGVERGALAQVVVADEQRQPAAAVDARVLADPADVARVAAGGLQRRRDVGQLHARRASTAARWPARPTAAGRTRRSATASAR